MFNKNEEQKEISDLELISIMGQTDKNYSYSDDNSYDAYGSEVVAQAGMKEEHGDSKVIFITIIALGIVGIFFFKSYENSQKYLSLTQDEKQR